MTPTDWRALCAELLDEVAARPLLLDRELVARARAALAETEPAVVGPTDQELADAFAEGCRDGSKAGEPPFLGGARAVLARYGHQPAPSAEGEVAELVAELRSTADGLESQAYPQTAALITRAADLLEQRHPAPVSVSERLQQMEDLAADAVSGLRYIEQTHGRLYGVGWDRVYKKADRLQLGHALPLPAGEVEP